MVSRIIAWYAANKRNLPWRYTRDPYKIWLSEIILQQTRVEQGLPYYHAFAKTFPTVQHLARTKEDKVLKLWQGLGYYSRARNLHATAKDIVKNLQGKFPTTKQALLMLPGIGDYTASAIASFAFNERCPTLDGNVYRFLSRYYGIDTPIHTTTARKEFYQLALDLSIPYNPALFNQAMMEFGALQCRPQNPACKQCPVHDTCYAFSSGTVKQYPVQHKPLKKKNRYFNYLVAYTGNKVYLKKRSEKDIWKNLYDFPLIESTKELKNFPAGKYELLTKKSNNQPLQKIASYKQLLTHQVIHAKFWKADGVLLNMPDSITVEISKLQKYAVPKVIAEFMKNHLVPRTK